MANSRVVFFLRKFCPFASRFHIRSPECPSFNSNRKRHSICSNKKLSRLFRVDNQRFYSETRSPQNEPAHYSVVSIVQRLHHIEESLRVKGYSVLRWGIAVIAITLTTLYLFREEVRDNVADEVAVVATKSLGDENVVNKAHEMTKVVLQDIVNDIETSNLTSNFVMSVLQREDVRKSAIDLTLFVLKDPKTNQKVSELAAATLKELLNQEQTRKLLLEYIKSLILDTNTQQACTKMVKSLLEDPQLKAFMADSLGGIVVSSIVTSKAIELGKNVTHGVVNDEGIRRETGDALWMVFKDAVTPSWFFGKTENGRKQD